jgi:hypothetical protein
MAILTTFYVFALSQKALPASLSSEQRRWLLPIALSVKKEGLPSANAIQFFYRYLHSASTLVAPVEFGGRAGYLDGGEGFQNLISMFCPFGNHPGVTRLKQYHLPFEV